MGPRSLVCWSQLLPPRESQVLNTQEFCKLAACNWPLRRYLHQRKHQTLKLRAPLVPRSQFTSIPLPQASGFGHLESRMTPINLGTCTHAARYPQKSDYLSTGQLRRENHGSRVSFLANLSSVLSCLHRP